MSRHDYADDENVDRYGKYGETDAAAGEDTWLDEGFFSLLVLVGAGLFVLPEPTTTTVGAVLIVAGAAGWLGDVLL